MWQKTSESEHCTECLWPMLKWQDCENAQNHERSTLLVKKRIKK